MHAGAAGPRAIRAAFLPLDSPYPEPLSISPRYTAEERRGRETAMKLIIAMIQPHRLEAVKQALADVEVFRLTVMDVQGFGRQRGQTEVYRGHEFAVNLLRKVQLMIAVNEEFLEPTIDAIIRGGRTGAGRRDRRRQDLRPPAGGLHPHPHRRARRRGNLRQAL